MLFLNILFVSLTFFSFGVFFYLILDKYNSRTSFKLKWNNNVVIISFFLLFVSSLFLAGASLVTDYFLDNVNQISTDYTRVGAFGDLIGGVLNPVVAFVGIIAASLAFYAQYIANKQVQKQIQIQQFESQFYEMLRLHKENVNEMKITGYDVNTQISKEYENGLLKTVTEHEIQVVKLTEGRKVFVTMAVELIACYEILEYFDNLWKTKFDKKDLLKLAYEIFFFGAKSTIPSSDIISKEIIENFKIEVDKIRKTHKTSKGRINLLNGVDGKEIKLHFKYSPFSGHESRLGHYYRHLYSTVKFVVNKENVLFNYKEVRKYLKILRSQMSNDEQLMLYYNYIIGFGKDWENKGFLTTYRMLHNLPINKVVYAEDPRKHFETFIKQIKKGEGALFEWGDKES